MADPFRRPASLLALCAVLLAGGAAGCNSGVHLRKVNVDQVIAGMSSKQVESILGQPASVDTKETAAGKQTVYTYTPGKDSVVIVFAGDKVQSKETTLRD